LTIIPSFLIVPISYVSDYQAYYYDHASCNAYYACSDDGPGRNGWVLPTLYKWHCCCVLLGQWSGVPVGSMNVEWPAGHCFPGFALVQLQDGQQKHMWELQVGDIIQVSRNEYSPIYMFSHQSPKEFSSFVRISTSSNHSIVLTPNHLLFVNDVLTEASQAKLRDNIELADETRANTVKIAYESGYFGLYNPRTLNGNIVVEGVVASTCTAGA
jgi:hypothetical protein